MTHPAGETAPGQGYTVVRASLTRFSAPPTRLATASLCSPIPIGLASLDYAGRADVFLATLAD